jgi:hypothetical protein
MVAAQSLDFMVGSSPKEEKPNQLSFNLSLSGGLAGGAGGAGKKWFTISDGLANYLPKHPIIGGPTTQILNIGTGKTT